MATAGIPERLVKVAETHHKLAYRWTGTTAKGTDHAWNVPRGGRMGTDDLEQWIDGLVSKGGGLPVRIAVHSLGMHEALAAEGTIWKWGEVDEDDESDESDDGKVNGILSLLPLDEGFPVDDETHHRADSPMEKLILIALEKPQVISSIASHAIELVQPAIDTALTPIVETLIDQISKETTRRTVEEMKVVLEEMLEVVEDPNETVSAAEPSFCFDKSDAFFERAADKMDLSEVPPPEQEPEQEDLQVEILSEEEVDQQLDAEIEQCWHERQQQIEAF